MTRYDSGENRENEAAPTHRTIYAAVGANSEWHCARLLPGNLPMQGVRLADDNRILLHPMRVIESTMSKRHISD